MAKIFHLSGRFGAQLFVPQGKGHPQLFVDSQALAHLIGVIPLAQIGKQHNRELQPLGAVDAHQGHPVAPFRRYPLPFLGPLFQLAEKAQQPPPPGLFVFQPQLIEPSRAWNTPSAPVS